MTKQTIMAANYPEIPSQDPQNTNLEDFFKKFDRWQQISLGVLKENKDLLEKIKSFQEEKQRVNEINIKLEKDVSKLHGIISKLQKEAKSMVKVEDEVITLRNILDKKELELQTLRTEIEIAEKIHKERLDKQKLEAAGDIKEIIRKHKKEEEEKITNLEKVLNSKTNDIKELEKSLLQLEDKKQREIVCLKIEFESKIKMFQRQKNQSNFCKSSTDQEIFRRKLHHLKEDYENKITELKQTISNLEKKMAMGCTCQQPARDRILLPLNKKKRY